jgi:hypothetical protein
MIKGKFFGRTYYLEILEKRVKGLLEGYRQNIAMIGDETVGKTSIIYEFLSRFLNNHIIAIYLEIRPESKASFTRRFIGILLYNFLLNSNIPLEEDLDYLVNKAARFIPKTAENIRLILSAVDKRKENDNFSELIALCDSIHKETGKYCVAIMDEFTNLEGLGFKNLYRDWSKLLITQKNTMFIIVSSKKFKTKAILAKNLSLLFGNFELVTVEPFDITTSEEYLERKTSGQVIERGVKNFIVHFTGGNPLYLEVITDSLMKSPDLSLPDTLESLLFDSCGILNQRFSNYIKRFLDSSNSKDYISILYLASCGKNRIKDIAHILHKQRKELMAKVNFLLECDTASRNGDFLTINDRVFSFWIRFVYQEKLQALTFDSKNQKTKFRDKIEDMIQEFLINSQKPIPERVSELLRLFEDEMIQMERKRIRLNHFREIKPLEFKGRSLKEGLIGRSAESLWIVAFKYSQLSEDDILDFTKECAKYRHKLQRKIIVTFADIDQTTRLRAMEEKIWTWDINNLNKILDLFSKPRLIF